MSRREVQNSNAIFPIFVKVFGKITSVREVQFPKAHWSMVVIPSGRVIFFRVVLFWNAYSPMAVMGSPWREEGRMRVVSLPRYFVRVPFSRMKSESGRESGSTWDWISSRSWESWGSWEISTSCNSSGDWSRDSTSTSTCSEGSKSISSEVSSWICSEMISESKRRGGSVA